MRLHLCGVRGSTPAPGADFVRYGGHTSCVAVAHDGEPPRLLLDAGTGIRNVPALLDGGAFSGSILLGHLHWDHTQGLPFFGAGDRPDAAVDLYLPAQPGATAVDLLARAMSPPSFPIGPGALRGQWRFHDLEPGRYEIEGFDVVAREIPHKGGRTFGYRISDRTGAMAYLSDHHPCSIGPGADGEGPYHQAAIELADNADVLLHDAQYTSAEFEARRDFGHATIRYAVGLGREAGVGRVVLFHHDPSRTDSELDAIGADFAGTSVSLAAEGMVVTVGPQA